METFVIITIAIVLGATFNRIRGGGIIHLSGETEEKKNTQQRRILWATVDGLLVFNPLVSIVMFLSTLTGWGFPISAAIGQNKTDYESKFPPLDIAARFITTKLTGQYFPKFYGVTWLCLHGLLTGALIIGAVYLLTAKVILIPLLLAGMGFCYLFARDWEKGEYLNGALQGLVLASTHFFLT